MKPQELKKLLGMELSSQSTAEKMRIQEAMRQHGLDPNSRYQETEIESSLVNTHGDVTYQHEVMPLHSHNFYEIISCRSNCGVEYLVGPYRYVLQKGDIILVRPGVSHCAILPDPLILPYERDIIWLSNAFLNSFHKILGVPPASYEKDLATYLIRTADTPWGFLCDMIHAGVQMEKKKHDSWQTLVLGNTLMTVSYLRQAYWSNNVQELKAEPPDLLDEMITYIEMNYGKKLVMSEVAKNFFVSERTISTMFRKRLGVTFSQFVTQRRLIEAKSMILKGLPLDLVAEQSGFADYSTFYRAFLKEFGISPKQFRKNSTASVKDEGFIVG